ncbi:hypothetical protein AURDEDRAFT_131182 [Auricularia subglabra TFB-10046 SS5]|uniref:Uncharacterized protein n=1 Tax=Auricularia subglabra (strain TFB-10046 / SS5) TaxID=717982 RepID=J0D6D9_AURST|nr:hypothetical protein AURDEDRAFT_131182 [Auricularia subglabra TFB-10046 SS5]
MAIWSPLKLLPMILCLSCRCAHYYHWHCVLCLGTELDISQCQCHGTITKLEPGHTAKTNIKVLVSCKHFWHPLPVHQSSSVTYMADLIIRISGQPCLRANNLASVLSPLQLNGIDSKHLFLANNFTAGCIFGKNDYAPFWQVDAWQSSALCPCQVRQTLSSCSAPASRAGSRLRLAQAGAVQAHVWVFYINEDTCFPFIDIELPCCRLLLERSEFFLSNVDLAACQKLGIDGYPDEIVNNGPNELLNFDVFEEVAGEIDIALYTGIICQNYP